MDLTSKIGDPKDQNRVPLWQAVPLKQPFSLGISPSDVCNFRCRYCIQSTSDRYPGGRIITWDDWLLRAQQIEELGALAGGPLKNLRFTGYGEPLMNPRLPDMVADVARRGLSPRREITTNASLLTHEMSDRLVAGGLTRLLVSLQGLTSESCEEMCGYPLDFAQLVDRIAYFYEHRGSCKLYVKIMDASIHGEEERQRFLETFTPICDMLNIEHMMNAYEGVDYEALAHHNIDHASRYGYKVEERVCCDTLFMYMTVDSKGDVDVCGCTYPALHIGNVNDTPLKDLWNGPKHLEAMRLHLQGRRKYIPECKRCHSVTSYAHPADNLDEHLEELFQKINKKLAGGGTLSNPR